MQRELNVYRTSLAGTNNLVYAQDKTCYIRVSYGCTVRSRDIAEIIARAFAKHLGRCRNFQVIASEESACCVATARSNVEFSTQRTFAQWYKSHKPRSFVTNEGVAVAITAARVTGILWISHVPAEKLGQLDRFLPRTACSAHVIAKLVARNWFSWPGQPDTPVYGKSWGLINDASRICS
jgi:hypothetical protein